ncbi:bifunctional phosphopantothenoylcysteine decarboxylase/phosphopantothenate--cysteine ligase CoaBC [Pleomorphomonas sp. NRK KF1]|uniref:bifunctional phosphopantothenoylcysteine decarboxylase/phosphopantothenate--cysteine ligase CoaBC n=1 Tax=Pleomorphomonas sp. NRK KF1 TaxID=2943000 RepID=UPI002042D5FB|nr:bifunctional phosphopantothenoylcysteine decarboxylase/phosphopantothenate--cysteine ligase CoaBC [Pleomorphomonas sp. NRK KF1]MCM5554723.1 bifunctional phosphopantothenoylcysteine decarboxylase/phosphopantothenate--cysteine ligase CoaBC [Pleomorphomonas sp. NRK KF1]
MLAGKRILIVIGGGIAAYKVLEVIRRLKERGAQVRVILTHSGKEFVTPMTVGALSGEKVFSDLFDPTEEQDIGHIVLSRDTDLILVAPATANLIARMANGIADELATASLLAAAAPIIVCPAMNQRMWAHPATQRNAAQLAADGVRFIGPAEGRMAERNETGVGRLSEPMEIVAGVEAFFAQAEQPKPLVGRHVLVTSGPTIEPIDPVRFITNRSSGKQGHAVAAAAARAGARVTLISGPVSIPDPSGVDVVRVETAQQMFEAVFSALPADAAIMAAAVSDWRPTSVAHEKIKKTAGDPPPLLFVENPDILATLGHGAQRPKIVVGFAAETTSIEANAARKLATKGADYIVANDVSATGGVFGSDVNRVRILSKSGMDVWPTLSKEEVAERLIALVADRLR